MRKIFFSLYIFLMFFFAINANYVMAATPAPTGRFTMDIAQNTANDAVKPITNITTEIQKWLQVIGKVMLIIGVSMFILSFKTEDAGMKEKSVYPILFGLILHSGELERIITADNFCAGSIVSLTEAIFEGAGGVMLVSGVIAFVLSIREESSSGKVKATLSIVTGLFLLSLPAIISALGV